MTPKTMQTIEMANPDDYLYEYAVIRYVPHVERGEFHNVGLLMMCKRKRWLHCEVHIDESRLKALDPMLDLPALRRQLGMFERMDVPFADLPVEERYRWLTAAKSAVLQTSPSHPGIAVPCEDPDPLAPLHATFERLMDELVR